jgi:hypothetical protein
MHEGKVKIISGVTTILFSILIIIETTSSQYDTVAEGTGIGPAFYPRLLLIILASMGILLIFQGLKKNSKNNFLKPIFTRLSVPFIIVVTVFFWAVPRLGFLLPSCMFLLIGSWVLGYRKKFVIFIFTLSFAISTWYVFNYYFEIILPTSPWFSETLGI